MKFRALAFAFAFAFAPALARAEDIPHPPPPTQLPALVTLSDADRLFHSNGLDLLVADASVVHAEGDLLMARAVQNPVVTAGVGYAFAYGPPVACVGCSPWQISVQVSDNATLFDVITGKRGLRSDAAHAALAAARLGRVDAERIIRAQVKQTYVQLVVAKGAEDFTKEVQQTMTQSYEVNKLRYPAVINEGDLSRIEVQKLEADQSVDQAKLAVRQGQIGLGFLLGARGIVPDFDVERTLLKFSVPAALQNASEQSLLEMALKTRADLRAWNYSRESAEAALSLAKRQRFPDVALFANYTQMGTGPDAVQPPTVTLGLSFNLPVFYQQQGEVRRAEADISAATVQREKALAQVVSDVTAAWAQYTAARDLVQRVETVILDRAKKARDIVDLQFKGGTATLMDFLDAERQYIAANQEHLQDLALYWGAVFALEQAVGAELK
jgi:cobalt-zinc-cadmium efflux system outer membrane protein